MYTKQDVRVMKQTGSILCNRIANDILDLLDSPKTVTEIYIKLRAEQAVISQQLSKLRRVGIVTADRQGKYVFYRINNAKKRQIDMILNVLNNEKLNQASQKVVAVR